MENIFEFAPLRKINLPNLARLYFLSHPISTMDANAELGDEVLFHGYFDTE